MDVNEHIRVTATNSTGSCCGHVPRQCDHCRKNSRRGRLADVRLPGGMNNRARLYSITSIFEEDKWVVQTQVNNRKRERYKQMSRMLALMLVPVVALITVTAVLLSNVITKQNKIETAKSHVQCFLALNDFIRNIHSENDRTLIYLFANASSSSPTNTMMFDSRTNENRTLHSTFNDICEGQFDHSILHNLTDNINDARRSADDHTLALPHRVHQVMTAHYVLTTSLLDITMTLELFSGDQSKVWRHLLATRLLMLSLSARRLQKGIMELSVFTCHLSVANKTEYVRLESEVDAHLKEAFAYQTHKLYSYHEGSLYKNGASLFTEKGFFNIDCETDIDDYNRICMSMDAEEKPTLINSSLAQIDSEVLAIDTIMEEYSNEMRSSEQDITGHTKKEIVIYSILAGIVSVVCIWVSLWYATYIQTLTHALSLYALKSSEKSKELAQEKRKTESLLYQMMPPTVANQLRDNNEVKAEYYETVTICFCDIVGFTSLSSISSPFQIVNLLNDLYSMFDEAIDQFDVYKVETIGDAYMVVSGLPEKNDNHTTEIADMSLDIRQAVDNFQIPHLPDKKLYIRIGFHTGSCMAGVVGTKMPRYCLFGDAVNIASRMESTSEAQKIQISQETRDVLSRAKSFILERRGEVDVKGKGMMTTYWLVGKETGLPKRNTSFMIPLSVDVDETEPLVRCNGNSNFSQLKPLNSVLVDGTRDDNLLKVC